MIEDHKDVDDISIEAILPISRLKCHMTKYSDNIPPTSTC